MALALRGGLIGLRVFRAEKLLLVWAADEMEAMREVGGELFEDKEDFLVAVIGDQDFLMMYAPSLP